MDMLRRMYRKAQRGETNMATLVVVCVTAVIALMIVVMIGGASNIANAVSLLAKNGYTVLGPGVPVGGDILPSVNNTFNIGSTVFEWKNGYFGQNVTARQGYFTDISANNLNVGNTTTTNTLNTVGNATVGGNFNIATINGVAPPTSAFVGVSDAQNITYKTLGSTNILDNPSMSYDFPASITRKMFHVSVPYTSIWTSANVNSTVTNYANGFGLNSSATANSSSRQYCNQMVFGQGLSWSKINFDKDVIILFYCIRVTADDHAESAFRFQIKNATTEGNLTATGIGLLVGLNVDSYLIQAESYGASGDKITSLATSLADGVVTEIMIVHQAEAVHPLAGNDKWYVNGVLKYTETTAGYVPTGNIDGNIMISNVNGATGGHACIWRVCQIDIWTGK